MTDRDALRGAFSRRHLLAGAAALAGAAVLGSAGCSLGTVGAASQAGPSEGGARAAAGLATVSDTARAPRRVTISMVGDVLVHEGVWMSGERPDGTRGYDHIFAPVRDALAAADIAIVNQETVLGGAALGLSGYPLFNSPQEIGDAETAAGFDVACSATNHALDRGLPGIEATRAFWRERHPRMVSAGIADSEAAASEIPLIATAGAAVAILNYTESTNGIPVPAAAPWCVSLLNRDRVAVDVASAREQGADLVVACPHWGTEYLPQPTDRQREWAQCFLEAGVDAVFGTHPHVLEPVEVLSAPDGRAMPVFWSLGNFISWQARKDAMVGGLGEVCFEMDGGAPRLARVALTPVVSHLSLDTRMAAYPISSYSEDLAQANAIRHTEGCADFSLAWCHDHCSEVLGELYDPARGVLELV